MQRGQVLRQNGSWDVRCYQNGITDGAAVRVRERLARYSDGYRSKKDVLPGEGGGQGIGEGKTQRRLQIKDNKRSGPLAQRLEQRTHNPLVEGSNPSGPTKVFKHTGALVAAHDDLQQILGRRQRQPAYAEVVDDEQQRTGQRLHELLARALGYGLGQVVQQDGRMCVSRYITR